MIGTRQLLSNLHDRLLIPDDTEESVSGSDFHLIAILALYDGLFRFAARTGRRWYVTAEVLILADLPDRVSNPWRAMPDVYVVLDLDNQRRVSLDTRAGAPFPQFICEVASESTWEEDVDGKQRLYADLGAQEYVVFDPTAQFLGEPLRAWHRDAEDRWVSWQQDTERSLTSTVLRLRLRAEGNLLRVYDPQNGQLPTAQEWEEIACGRSARLATTVQLRQEQEAELAAARKAAQPWSELLERAQQAALASEVELAREREAWAAREAALLAEIERLRTEHGG